ncbi:hypothetical protein So717_37940 [Roseobacter cerasinus]|uniref:Putative Flp pilus-assembly TadG-like N-terminal domain-containing protein n=1 Tax=Roseobacter cerasinus TaxID=2602289 RepID=A0A640VY70_9RHOB|nr:Tad domain-containing protein [Roseobacter cerasinus]GFE52041.1 hypothetical protein So717_37940 [Roseobacter cerasinus]
MHFAQNEDGVVTIFSIFIMLMMLMVAGIGVDLMQNEMRRTALQNTVDRAVLAAADLDQTRPPTEVVEDYFAKSGLREHLTSVQPNSALNYRNIAAEAYMETDTQFMSLLGVDTLPVPAASQAVEDVPNVEISLVLDYSQSMNSQSKMVNLHAAAKTFVDIVLRGSASTVTSINLVPYAGQVNPGPWMFQRLGGVRYATRAMDAADGGIPEHLSHTQLPEGAEGGTGPDPDVRYVYPNTSSCLEFSDTAFFQDDLRVGTYDQTPYFDGYRHSNSPLFVSNDDPDGAPQRAVDDRGNPLNTIEWGWCPEDITAITYASNNAAALKREIERMPMYDGTGTPYGMKWGLALLNPATRPLFAEMAAPAVGLVRPEFAERPAAFSDTETVKYIVLMTDGGITRQTRPADYFDEENTSVSMTQRSGDRVTVTDWARNVEFFYAQCDLAKHPSRNVVIYTIAFEAPGTPEDQMKYCASSDSHFFRATGREQITAAFATIARKINELRLTQ